jgi:hypothetical protein
LDSAAARVGVIVLGSGLCGGIHVVCPAVLCEFAPTAQRGAVLAIFGAIFTLAGIVAPLVTGSIIDGLTVFGRLQGPRLRIDGLW